LLWFNIKGLAVCLVGIIEDLIIQTTEANTDENAILIRPLEVITMYNAELRREL
jgi:hypothetical protein